MFASLNLDLLAAATAPATAPTTTTSAMPFHWLIDLLTQDSVAHAVLMLSLVISLGLGIGRLKVFKVGLGVAGVLFAGLLFGHFQLKVNHEVLDFARDFGLILFVYTIGMQVGPGFFSSLRRNGLPMNIAAASIVLGGSAITVGMWYLFLRTQLPVAMGLLSGGTTNTPSLAAAQQALGSTPPEIGAAYAIAYPMGIVGVLLTMLTIKWVFGVDIEAEKKQLTLANGAPKLESTNLEVTNAGVAGRRIEDIPTLSGSGVVISRILRGQHADLAHPDSVLALGDVLHAVGPAQALKDIAIIIGSESKVDVKSVVSDIMSQRVLVTQKAAVGQSVQALAIHEKYGVQVTRITRAEVELPVTSQVRLNFGDRLTIVGEKSAITQVSKLLGDKAKQLDLPLLAPIFVGIALGVIAGSMPIVISGLPAALKLGLAGGPLLVAILLSRIGRIGPLVWWMPQSANYMLREVGIVLFLACVGLKSGDNFAATFMKYGMTWIAIGMVITIVPVMLVGIIARAVFKMNYVTLTGLLAGSMTDPPALAFAQSVTGSDMPTISYATVYPLVMLLRVMIAQIIVLVLMG